MVLPVSALQNWSEDAFGVEAERRVMNYLKFTLTSVVPLFLVEIKRSPELLLWFGMILFHS